jgi:hypothetical protein
VFFSGGALWVGVIALFAVGYQKRRRRSKETLAQWAKEEAVAELRRARTLIPETRVHIVLPSQTSDPSELPRVDAPKKDVEVPRVEHDGQWHTLH